jgi:FKBP-type peptidyl-prolyl cis-trans isomerase
MAVSKSTVQRIIIGIIALTMTVGTLGAYFIIILQNKDANNQSQNQSQTQYPNYPVDSTAYKVNGAVTELQKADLTVGTGDEAKAGDSVKVHYKGTFAQTGQKFDSSYDTGEPVTFALKTGQGGVIPGWVEGIPGMKVGGKRRLVIPSSMAYGTTGYTGAIPPNTDLVFEVELLAVNPKQ